MRNEVHIYSRRDFLCLSGIAVLGTLMARPAFPQTARPFNLLVVGDSIISGQGLSKEQKSYTLVKNWIESESKRRVDVKVKAHSGASINTRPAELEALKKAGIDETRGYPDEVNFTFPSIRAQIDTAAKEYSDRSELDLILMTGSVTDTRLSTIFNPFRKNEELRGDIVKHSYEDMFALLKYTAETFPNAQIIVIGYHPFISKFSSKKKVLDHLMEVEGVFDPLKFAINNPLGRGLGKHYIDKMIERSLIFARESAVQLKRAVGQVNQESGKQRVIFVPSPIKEENSLGTKDSLVFEFDKHEKLSDPMTVERLTVCQENVSALSKATKMKLRTRLCEMAGIGHPNPQAAKLIAEAIKEQLTPIFAR